MANHTLFLLNARLRKTEKQIKDLRCQLFCNKEIRIGIEGKLRSMKAVVGQANREGDFEMVGDLQFTINIFRAELSRQMVHRKNIIDSLEMFGANILNINARIKEELSDAAQA